MMTTEFKMVPVEPTEEMVYAMATAIHLSKTSAQVYADLIAAAPASPQAFARCSILKDCNVRASGSTEPASPQAAQPVADNSDWENTYGPDYEVDDVGSVSKVDTLLSVRDGYCRCGRLVAGHALSTHADAGEVQSPEYQALAVKACKQEADIRALRAALLFYANRDHFSTEEMDAWDSCSGEPSNILWHEEEPWFIEDGEIARVALSTTAKPEADHE